MRILHISDTHGYHRRLQNLPEAGLIDSGDIIFSNGTVLTGAYTLNLRPYNVIEI
jgi:hypothetical protein